MGDYTEFLRIQSKNSENERRRKNNALRRRAEAAHAKLHKLTPSEEIERRKKNRKRRQNKYTLKPLEVAGLLTKHLPGRHDQSTHGNRVGASWGDSHGVSSNITAIAARQMKQEGYVEGYNSKANNLAARSALRGVRESKGMSEPLYSGHYSKKGKHNYQVGDEVTIPLTSATGDKDTASSYASEKERTRGEKDSVLFEFEEGTKARGYLKNDIYDKNDPDFNYHWDEAIVSGKFEVVGVETEEDSYFHYGEQKMVSYPKQVYKLRQTAVFDPDSGEWVSLVGKHFRGRHNQESHGNWSDGPEIEMGSRRRAANVSPFPAGDTRRTHSRTAGSPAAARKTTPAKKTTAAKPPAKKAAAPPKKAAAKKTSAISTSDGLYDKSRKTVAERKSIPRINRGGTHIMQGNNGKPLVANSYEDPGEAYYARNAGPKKITNERLKEIFEDPSKMTPLERRMVASAGGAKSLDGTDAMTVDTSRGPRDLERYQVFGQLRSKIAPGSGDRSAQREGITSERREKMAAKRRESGKVSSVAFGQYQQQITDDWSTDGGKTVPCVFCNKKMSPRGMSIETPKPKQLGGGYKDRGGRWPSHHTCNTKAGEYAQKDPIAYQEEMMKKFAKMPVELRKRLPHVYDSFPQLGKYPGTAAERTKYMAKGPK